MQFLTHPDTAETASGSALPVAPALGYWLGGWVGHWPGHPFTVEVEWARRGVRPLCGLKSPWQAAAAVLLGCYLSGWAWSSEILPDLSSLRPGRKPKCIVLMPAKCLCPRFMILNG